MVKYRALDGTFGELADPTRRGIMLHLAKGEASVSELAKGCPMLADSQGSSVEVYEAFPM